MTSLLPRLSRPFLVLAALVLSVGTASARELSELKLLYIGPRATDYVPFLKSKVARIENRLLTQFKPEEAAAFDVVLLDWPQSEETRDKRKLNSPLGRREDWTKPTVLLGSAGLNLAVAWKMKGGSGCTCMDPLAYDLRDHEIFERPFPIDRGRMSSIPTPPDFKEEIKEPEIKVLPLFNIGRPWKAGWCTHTSDFAGNPDVEIFSGGVNHQTPTSAGLWRQGNFLHFGFEQSPAEMNELGGWLLLNSIAYIARFTEDRAIATTPSVFAGPVAYPRGTPARWLRNPARPVEWVAEILAPDLWTKLRQHNRGEMAAWFDRNQAFLHPNAEQRLEVDEDLLALGLAFDKPEFFERTLADLGHGDTALAGRARRLLERYVPEGPKDGAPGTWAAWWQENQAYAFASDAGVYRWYVDPLAKKRGVPTQHLRGPRRADR